MALKWDDWGAAYEEAPDGSWTRAEQFDIPKHVMAAIRRRKQRRGILEEQFILGHWRPKGMRG